ncbi:YopX family protein [Rathayibacter sp. AY1D9]|uniref:YopX family protein n=1 Tax=Rathayibacter sp. AY1D9 TaxID=2080548 RepID=UPI000CE88160|nr:YopX family protein [Rathayibacter sp. AY1D9]PPH83909.1 hypothetical protein C5C50_04210 [Rathayibacter sp. AY1D9]
MSRETKFRVWQPKERRMLFNCGVQRPVGGYLWGFGVPAGAGVDDIEHYGRHDSVMQFTGLQDKNGAEIYEGDILLGAYNAVYDYARWSVSFRDGRYQTDCVALHQKDDGFRDISHGGYSNPYLDGKTCASFEGIGNIHENPDLLA